MIHKLTIIAAYATTLYAFAGHAESLDPASQVLSFSGFGTLGVVHSSEHQANFSSTILKAGGAGFSDNWSSNVDSLIGAQVTASVTPQLSAVLQVIAEQNYDATYRPHVEWANIKYQFTPDFSVRIGRSLLNIFMDSEFRKVGYADPWVRTSPELYSLVPITSSDGIESSYRFSVGHLINTVQGNFGQSDSPLPYGGGNLRVRSAWGFSDALEYGPLTVRVAYQAAHLTVAVFDPLFAAFQSFGPEGIAIADRYGYEHKPFAAETIGISYDPGGWFVTAQWGHSNAHSVAGVNTAWDLGGGYRIGRFTPYLTFAQVKTNINVDPGLSLTNLPPDAVPIAAALNAGLNSLLETNPAQKTISVGSRWDFTKNVDLKVQYDHSRHGPGSSGTLYDVQPGFRPGGTHNLISATVDFIF